MSRKDLRKLMETVENPKPSTERNKLTEEKGITYRGLAKKFFKEEYHTVVSTGFGPEYGGIPESFGIEVKPVAYRSASDGMTQDQISQTPYSVLRYSYTDWEAGEGVWEGIQLGFIVKQAAFSAECFIYAKSPEDLKKAWNAAVNAGYFTNRKTPRDKNPNSKTNNPLNQKKPERKNPGASPANRGFSGVDV